MGVRARPGDEDRVRLPGGRRHGPDGECPVAHAGLESAREGHPRGSPAAQDREDRLDLACVEVSAPPRGLAPEVAHRSPPHRHRLGQQFRQPRGALRGQPSPLGRQRPLVVAEQIRRSGERTRRRGRQPAERRQHFGTDPVPEEAGGGVGRIFEEFQPLGTKVPDHLDTRPIDERPDHGATTRGNPGEPTRAGAPEEPDENRLRLVVLGVSGGDPGGPDAHRLAPERRIPGPPRFRLDVAALDVDAHPSERNREPLAHPRTCVGIEITPGPQSVVDVQRRHLLDRMGVPQPGQRRKQGRGVGSTGEGDEHGVATPKKVPFLASVGNSIDKLAHSRVPCSPDNELWLTAGVHDAILVIGLASRRWAEGHPSPSWPTGSRQRCRLLFFSLVASAPPR